MAQATTPQAPTAGKKPVAVAFTKSTQAGDIVNTLAPQAKRVDMLVQVTGQWEEIPAANRAAGSWGEKAILDACAELGCAEGVAIVAKLKLAALKAKEAKDSEGGTSWAIKGTFTRVG